MNKIRNCLHLLLPAVILAGVLLTSPMAMAHAILVASTPAVHETVKGPEVNIRMKFNSRIDGAHSRLFLVDSNGNVQTLVLVPQKSPDTLGTSGITLSAGAYTIRWQALAADGHITRGEIPFTVQ